METFEGTVVFKDATLLGEDSEWKHLRIEMKVELQGDSENFNSNDFTINTIEEILIIGDSDSVSLRKNERGELSSYILKCGEWVPGLPKENSNAIQSLLASFAKLPMRMLAE